MSWICVGCKQVQATKSAFMPVMNHTHQIVQVAPTLQFMNAKVINASDPAPARPAHVETKLQQDVRTTMEKDGANADLIAKTVRALQ